MCEKCKVIRRHGTVQVICQNPRHQVSGRDRQVRDGTYRRRQHPAARSGSRSVSRTSTASAGRRPTRSSPSWASTPNTNVRGPHRGRRDRASARGSSTATSRSRATCAASARQNIKRLMEIGCYRGIRHRRGHAGARPAHASTNARSRKGHKPTVGVKRRSDRRAAGGVERVAKPAESQRARSGAEGAQEHRRRPGPHQDVVQQHARDAHRQRGQRHRLGERRVRGLQGLAQVDALRRPGDGRACAKKGMEHGLQKVEVFVHGPGSGRETAIRSLQAAGLEVISVKDVTPVPHNGCRPRKRRRV